MAKINGIEGISDTELSQQLAAGGKFVVFEYAISILVMSFKRGSDIYYIRPGESAFTKGLPYTLLTMVTGWWGIPWGPIYTIMAIATNFSGGKDVTEHLTRKG